MIASRADTDGVRSGGVDPQHAAHGRDGRAAGVGGEVAVDLPQFAIQVFSNNAGLDADGRVIDPFDGPHVAGEIDNDAAAEAAAGQPGSRAAGDERDPLVVAVVGEEGDVVAMAGAGDADGAALVQAAIGGVLHAAQGIEEEVALEGASQVFGDPLLLVVHG